jgi:hypothetical protein
LVQQHVHLVLLAGLALHLMVVWCNLVATLAAVEALFCKSNRPWFNKLSALIVPGNATLVESTLSTSVYVSQFPPSKSAPALGNLVRSLLHLLHQRPRQVQQK